MNGELRLSVLDQSPIPEGTMPAQALHNTLDLAELADDLGYHRYPRPRRAPALVRAGGGGVRAERGRRRPPGKSDGYRDMKIGYFLSWEELQEYVDAGVDELYIQQVGGPDDGFFEAPRRDVLPRFA